MGLDGALFGLALHFRAPDGDALERRISAGINGGGFRFSFQAAASAALWIIARARTRDIYRARVAVAILLERAFLAVPV